MNWGPDVLAIGGAVTGPELGFIAQQYHPDREPELGTLENFVGGAEALAWRWGNQGSATLDLIQDAAFLTAPIEAGNVMRCRWTDAPASGDYLICAKLSARCHYAHGGAVGLILLETGTEAVPTLMTEFVMWSDVAGSGGRFDLWTTANYTAAPSVIFNSGGASRHVASDAYDFYMAAKFVDSTNVLTLYFSGDGMSWAVPGSRTLTANPISVGFCATTRNASSAGGARACVKWFRILTDASQIAAEPFTVGR